MLEHSAEVLPVNIEDEMKNAYLDYAMSVIIGRAIPDIRDGLKPAHRRILYAMYREGLLANKRYSKCAGVVGEVLKKYHPHGDAAVYDTLVRMAQPWNMRYTLIDGQGNFGSIDGDSAAAYRYTEAKLMKIAEELLENIDEETVDFGPNFDGTVQEPLVLPSRIPQLLINGSDGIAVGMATKIPPHNLTEVLNACLYIIENPDCTTKDLMKLVPGPDFPTGAFIHGREGIVSAYEKGRGSLQIRARALIEPIARGDREQIVVTEIPYQVNKARLIERIAELVNEGKLEGISDVRDESDREGLRIVIELRRGAVAGVILNQLYAHTSLQTSYGIILLAIVSGQPRVLNLKDALSLFIDHRKDVVVRRTTFRLRKAEERAHILTGLKIAVENIDEVIALIKKSSSPSEAKEKLCKKFKLSEVQSQAILDLKLQRLTALERDKIVEEFNEIQKTIKELKAILADEKRVMKIIGEELNEIKNKYGDERRTEIIGKTEDLDVEDLIQDEEMVVTISHRGYIKRNPISIYRAQKRGGKGKQGMTTRDEDFVEKMFVASTHSYLLIFSSTGKLHWVKVHEIPQAGRVAKGQSIANLIKMPPNEKIAAVLTVKDFDKNNFVMMATKNGTVKKTELSAYSNPRSGGIIGLTIAEGDELISADITNGEDEVILATKLGQSIRFSEKDVRNMGRSATGVRGIRLDKDDFLVGMEVAKPNTSILTIAENGYGKRSPLDEYRLQSRGGTGIIAMKITDKTGNLVGIHSVADTDHFMIVTTHGKIIRSRAKEVSVIGRSTQGVKMITPDKGEKVTAFALLAEDEDEGE